MNLTIPTPQPLVDVPPLPEFDGIRKHQEAILAGIRVTIGANVATGAHLARLADQARPAHGGKRETGTALAEKPWREIVAEQTGKSWEYCRRAEKIARDLADALKGKRGDDAKRTRALIENPHREWTFEDYETISRTVGEHFDVLTWTELLQEFGILPKSGPGKGDGTKRDEKKALPLHEQARIFARGFVTSLTPADPAKYRKYLAALELHPTGDTKEPSLTEIKATLEERMAEVSEVIARKLN